MQQIFNKYKQIIIGAGVLVLIVLVYVFFRGGSSSDTSTLVYNTDTTPAQQAQANIGQSIIVALENLRRLKVDTTFFQNVAYLGLVDHSQSTTTENLGRPNPFLPIIEKKATITVSGTEKK